MSSAGTSDESFRSHENPGKKPHSDNAICQEKAEVLNFCFSAEIAAHKVPSI